MTDKTRTGKTGTDKTGTEKPSRTAAVVDRLEAPMRRRDWWRHGLIVLLLFAIAATAFGVVDARRAPVAARAATTVELNEQAGRILAEVFSARAVSWEQDRAHARTLVTPTLAASVATAFAASPPTGTRSVRWEPLQVGVVDAQEDSGTAVVVVNVIVTPEQGEPTVRTKSVNAEYRRSGDRWLLNGVDELQ
ncbi:hypothetical protein ACFQNE_16175 [Gordonia phosphorivorans]|uniref:Mammalian cell entry protein n=1 Tax=Gordonia phosphorivorans TaxID=1056982 RepID=A0ABV6H364_9ACTN